MVEQPGELHLLFSGSIEQRHGEYIVSIPQEEVERGVLDAGSGYKFGVFDGETETPEPADAAPDERPEPEDTALTTAQAGEKESSQTAQRDSWTQKSPSSRNGNETPVSKGEMLDVKIEALGEKGDGIAKVGEGFSAATQEDLREVWLTQLSLHGVDEFAIVEPESYTGQMCVENVFDTSSRHFVTVRRFDSRAAAETWLDWRSIE